MIQAPLLKVLVSGISIPQPPAHQQEVSPSSCRRPWALLQGCLLGHVRVLYKRLVADFTSATRIYKGFRRVLFVRVLEASYGF